MVECTALEMRHRCKPIGGSNPSLSAKFIRGRAILSDCRQPFDEPLLLDVPPADFVKSAKEVLDRALFLGERPEIG